MVLDEEALEAMLARGRVEPERQGDMVTTDETDDFEVYERSAEPEPEPEPPQARAPPAPEPADDYEVYERNPPASPMPDPEPVAEPEPPVEPVPEAPAPPVQTEQPAPKRRPEVWPPIRSHKPQTSAPEPAPAPTPAPTPRPAPTQAPPAPAPVRVHASGARIAIVQATFNIELTDTMAGLAKDKARELGAEVVAHQQCAGVYDVPLPTKRLLSRDDVDAVVVIGVVVQGETKHDEIITHATAKTLQELSLQFDKPVGLAITGPGMTWQQAEARVHNAAHGVEAVLALLTH